MRLLNRLSFYIMFVVLVVYYRKECSGKKESAIKCRKKIDLGIVIDASASMGEQNFKTAKEFAKKLLTRFRIAPSKTRVSLNYFSIYHHIVTKFNDDLVSEELKLLVDNMKFEASFTNLARTIDGLRYNVFPRKFGSRARKPGTKMVAVFLTDAFDSLGPEETKYYADAIRKFGVTTFAVGVSGENSNEGIKALSSKPIRKHAFTMYKNKLEMDSEIDNLVKEICK